MSIDDERHAVPRESKRRYAAAAFCALLILSVFWPSPVVSINRLWFNERIDVDELSFLGSDVPSWLVVFWCIPEVFLLILLKRADPAADPQDPLRQVRAIRFERSL